MNNNFIQNLGLLKAQSYYGGSSPSFRISGRLVEKQGNNIKLDIGKGRTLEAELKTALGNKVGDQITINRKDINKSRILNSDLNEERLVSSGDRGVLEKLNLPVNEDTRGALNALENHGVDISKANIQNFIQAKKSLGKIIEDLNYDTAIKLMEKDVDLEEESLERVAEEVEGSKDEKENFSLLKFLGLKKDMSTEEAEKIAEKIYGNKMGKDITDIIKALDKAGLEINKKAIDEVNKIFDKISDLEDLEDLTVIDAIKNKIATNIDNLYKLKNKITKDSIGNHQDRELVADNSYTRSPGRPPSISHRDLELMEDDIRDQLRSLDLRADDENIALAKDLIRSGMEVSRENMDRVNQVKEALGELQASLDYEKLAGLVRAGVDIEREDIISLVELLKTELNGLDGPREDFDQGQIENILKALENMEKISDQDLIELIKRGADFKLGKLGFIGSDESQKNLALLLKELEQGSTTMVDHHIKTITTLNKLENINFNTIAHQMNTRLATSINRLMTSDSQAIPRELDISQENIIRDHVINNADKLGIRGSALDMEGARALVTNNLTLNRENIARLYEINAHMDSIRQGLTSHMLRDLVNTNRDMEHMEIEELANFIENKENKDGIIEGNLDANNLVENIQALSSQRDSILSLMIKNALSLNLKEVQGMNFFLNNEAQITSKLEDILAGLKESRQEEIKDLVSKIDKFLEKSTADFKSGDLRGERFYQQLARLMREADNKTELMESNIRESFEKNSENLRETIDIQGQLNREDGVLQLPIMMQNELKNLQMYVMNNKRSGKKIDPNDMSVLLNFDTNNMGNINIYTAVNYKNVIMKVGVKNLEDKNYFENNLKKIEGLLDDLGYELKEMSFRIEEGQDILTLAAEDPHIHQARDRFLDITI